jgi:HAD superfamily hydrolase (TIGR01509 family)
LIQAVIFDVDGTLVDSNRQHVLSWKDAFAEFSVTVGEEALQQQVGKGGDQLKPVFLNPQQLAEFGEQLGQRKDEIFRARYRREVQPFPRVPELLKRLRRDGKRVALATSGKRADFDEYVELLGVGDLVDVIATAEDAARTKPAPDLFDVTRKMLALPAEAAVVVGDSVWDAEAARAASLAVIGLLCGGFHGEQLRRAGCIAVYRDPAHLLENYEQSPLMAS